MAAYGALLSVSHLLHQILHPPPLYSNIIIVDTEQIQFLRAKIELLIDFLETYPSRRSPEIAELEARIKDAAYAAEDIIESNVIDQIHASDLYRKRKTPTLSSRKGSSSQGIERVLEKFISIEKERDLLQMRVVQGVGDVQLQSSAAARSPLHGGKITMVGFDHHLIQIMSQLASDESSRRVISIVGMCGIGKTTLTTAVYNHPFIVEHFEVHAWVTVSQEYTVEELLLCLLYGDRSKAGPYKYELGLKLHQKLSGRKYLIVMDDLWDTRAWDEVKMFLPDNKNGSRVLVNSRHTNFSGDLGYLYKMDFLDQEHSWDLFCKIIFVEDCPVELVEIGKDIVKRCGGLPLALVLISGLLAKSERTKEHWEFIARDTTSALNFEDNEKVTKILSLSYAHLPVHLKPCFLYLAMFPEDGDIRISMLVKLWVAEGLIKPRQNKCLEQTAHDYLEDLISRNLILVGERGSKGNVKSCKLHDVVRDLCIAQAKKEKFAFIAKLDKYISPNINETVRRLSISPTGEVPLRRTIEAVESVPLIRSLLSHQNELMFDVKTMKSFRLLKVVHGGDYSFVKLINLTNLRYVFSYSKPSFSSMGLCWNLESLLFPGAMMSDLPHEIWLMPQLRHLKMYSFNLPEPPDGDHNVIVFENLLTIKGVKDFKCSEHVLKRIPNLKKLGAVYDSKTCGAHEQAAKFCLRNLGRLQKLESLKLYGAESVWPTIAFPISLKKLKLNGCCIHWEDLSIVGSLPNLEVLTLGSCATQGEEWNPIEEQFCRLKFLEVASSNLKIWGAENYHFPLLERLFLMHVPLEMIPISFSEILTLEQIYLEDVNDSVRTSAREISDERVELGYEPLRLRLC